METFKKFWFEEDGLGTVEMVMLIAALMCIALLFREQIYQFATNIMKIVFDIDLVDKPSAS